MSSEIPKKAVAREALKYLEEGTILGIGTGSTVNYFIEALAEHRHLIEGAVSSSEETTKRLKALAIDVFDLNSVDKVPVYIDGADEVNSLKQLIKGGGGALTREKIIAAVADKFICIVDESKKVGALGAFPLPVEVIPMARSYVARELVKLGGNPNYRSGFTTDNGNIILDVYGLTIYEPIKLEQAINQIVGVVSNGLFAERAADIVLVASQTGVETIR